MKIRVVSRWRLAVDNNPTIARLVQRHRVASERLKVEVGKPGGEHQGIIGRLTDELTMLRAEIRKALSKNRLAQGKRLPMAAAAEPSGGRGCRTLGWTRVGLKNSHGEGGT